MSDGVLYQRLKSECRKFYREHVGLYFQINFKLVTESCLLQPQIGFQKVQFVLDGDHFRPVHEGRSQKVCRIHHKILGFLGIEGDQRRDGIESVEKKMGFDLSCQKAVLGLL